MRKVSSSQKAGTGVIRVVHVITSLNFGGIQKYIEVLARNTKYSCWEHHFCAIGGQGGAVAGSLASMGSRVVCLDRPTRIPSTSATCALYTGYFKN